MDPATLTWGLLAIGALALGGWLWRRARSSANPQTQAEEPAAEPTATDLAGVHTPAAGTIGPGTETAAAAQADAQADSQAAAGAAAHEAAEEAAQAAAEEAEAARAAERVAEQARREAQKRAAEHAAEDLRRTAEAAAAQARLVAEAAAAQAAALAAEQHIAAEAAARQAEQEARQALEQAARQAEFAAQQARRAEAEFAARQAEQIARANAEAKAPAEAAAREAQRAAEQAAALEAQRAAAARAAETPPAAATVSPSTSPLVMVADDSKVVRVKTSRLLTQHGYRVVLAEDGAQAAQLLEAELPQVLITDVEMPGMDGFELTRHVRAHPRAAGIPIIMITSADDRLKQAAAEAGVTLVLGKPYPEEELLACIERSRAPAHA